jgi:hypothetical protein
LAKRIQKAERFTARATIQMAAAWTRGETRFQPKTHKPRKWLRGRRRPGLDGQRGPEDVPDIFGIFRPVHAELELHRKPRHDADGEIDEEQLAPEAGHPKIRLVAGGYVAAFHPGDEEGQPEGEGDEDKMEDRRHGELKPAEGQDIHPGILLEGTVSCQRPVLRAAFRRGSPVHGDSFENRMISIRFSLWQDHGFRLPESGYRRFASGSRGIPPLAGLPSAAEQAPGISHHQGLCLPGRHTHLPEAGEDRFQDVVIGPVRYHGEQGFGP